MPTSAELNAAFAYDAASGQITSKRTGKVVGAKSSNRYLNISHAGRTMLAHRMIWVMVNGELSPDNQVDHVNGDKSDNRLENLRLADGLSNRWNSATRKDSGTGHKGVQLDGASYRVRIHRSGVCRYDRKFKSLALAILAYERAVVRIDGFYANAGDFSSRQESVGAVAKSFAQWRARKQAA